MSGLFQTFNIAKRGMNAQQTALQVVSHNVSNANTDGYSVQRANMQTTEPFGMPSISSAAGPGQLGTGVEISSITRARDEFLDTQIRKETSTQNNYQSREQFLSDIESIFTEPSDSGLSSTMGKFWDAWQQLSSTAEPNSTARTLVAQNGAALANTINHSYDQLDALEDNAATLINNKVFETSSILKQIQDLNGQIRSVLVGGKEPNDLMDRRDVLLDQLSQNFNYDITKTDFGGIKITAKTVDSNGNPTKIDILDDETLNEGMAYINDFTVTLHDSSDSTKTYTLNKDNIPAYIPASYVVEANTVKLDLNVDGDQNKRIVASGTGLTSISDLKKYYDVEEVRDSSGNLQGYKVKDIKPHVVFYNPNSYNKNNTDISLHQPASFDNGTFKGLESISEDVTKYKDQLNSLAKTIAISVNAIHSNYIDPASQVNKGGINFFVSQSENNGQDLDKPGISELERGLTVGKMEEPAKDIQVNQTILDDPKKINAGKEIVGFNATQLSNTGNGERALQIAQLRNINIDIQNVTDRASFVKDTYVEYKNNSPSASNPVEDLTGKTLQSSPTGITMGGYFNSTTSNLGVSNQEAKRMVTNQTSLLNQLTTRRESVSGVSLDEEMANMIQFQRSYEANAKMISVVDQLLDVVVNGLMK